MRLEPNDTKFWAPEKYVTEYVNSLIPEHGMVLEIGPGRRPLGRADVYVDMYVPEQVPKELVVFCDVAEEPLPFPDKKFDFIYCRHTVEDLYNPFLVLREMSRVGKAGYIETPSPMAEMCIGTDHDALWRGYHHHHWFVWTDGKELKLASKYPMIEYLKVDEELLVSALKDSPRYWNTSYFWTGNINWKHIRNGHDFHMVGGGSPTYPAIVQEAMMQSSNAINEMYENIQKVLNVN